MLLLVVQRLTRVTEVTMIGEIFYQPRYRMYTCISGQYGSVSGTAGALPWSSLCGAYDFVQYILCYVGEHTCAYMCSVGSCVAVV